jgi:hypothetical protein
MAVGWGLKPRLNGVATAGWIQGVFTHVTGDAMKVSPPGQSRSDWRRTAVWVTGLVLLVWFACFRFPIVWVVTGIGEANRPFMDLYGILAASDAAQAGVDPFLPNDFDPYHRPHVYTTWWLELGRLGLVRADTFWLGWVLLVAVLVSAAVMVRPGTRKEGIGLLLLLISPAFLMAVNRANNDLVVFVLISAGLLCFRRETAPLRSLGILLFALSAVLKYYPLVTLVLLLELRSRREFVLNLALYALLLLLAWPGLEPGLRAAAKYMPQPDWLYAYGAPVLLRNLGIAGAWGWLVAAGFLAGWAAVGAYRKPAEPMSANPAGEREFMLGAAMLIGLFFLGSSFVYKLVFAVWLLPRLWQPSADPVEARWRRLTWWLLLTVVWFEGVMAVGLNLIVGPRSESLALGWLKAVVVISPLLTWALIACLLRSLLAMLWQSLRIWGAAMRRPSVGNGLP